MSLDISDWFHLRLLVNHFRGSFCNWRRSGPQIKTTRLRGMKNFHQQRFLYFSSSAKKSYHISVTALINDQPWRVTSRWLWSDFRLQVQTHQLSVRMPLFTRQLPLPATGRILAYKRIFTGFTMRTISTDLKPTSLRRSYLYVPASSDRMLEKSITTGSDVIIYDLEDSVSPVPLEKVNARVRLKKFLGVRTYLQLYSNLKVASV